MAFQRSRLSVRSRTVIRSFFNARCLSAARRFQVSRLRRNTRARRAGELLKSVIDMAWINPGTTGHRFNLNCILPEDDQDTSLAASHQTLCFDFGLDISIGNMYRPKDDTCFLSDI